MSWPTAVCGAVRDDHVAALDLVVGEDILDHALQPFAGQRRAVDFEAARRSAGRAAAARATRRAPPRTPSAHCGSRAARSRSSSGGGCRRGRGRRRARSRSHADGPRDRPESVSGTVARSMPSSRQARTASSSMISQPCRPCVNSSSEPSSSSGHDLQVGRVLSRRAESRGNGGSRSAGRPSPRRGTRPGSGTGTSWRSSGERIVSPKIRTSGTGGS